MFGIDAPEKDQQYGQGSITFLESFLHKPVTLNKTGVDRYGRTLGIPKGSFCVKTFPFKGMGQRGQENPSN